MTVKELATEAGLTGPYLAKVIQDLAQSGIVKSRKGPGGGVLLARRPDEISLSEVIFAVDQIEGWRRCVLEDRPCSEIESCPLHQTCRVIREEILGRTTLADLSESYVTKNVKNLDT